MGMPDTGYVYSEMQNEIFNLHPEIFQILWKEDGKSYPELRLKKSFKELPYADGKNSELHLASKDLQELWNDIVKTLQAKMLRGWGENPHSIYVMDKNSWHSIDE